LFPTTRFTSGWLSLVFTVKMRFQQPAGEDRQDKPMAAFLTVPIDMEIAPHGHY
jgi:hypothetical protein